MSRNAPARKFEGLEILRHAKGWIVVDAERRWLSEPMADRDSAAAWRDARVREIRARRGITQRPCLRCAKPFPSEGVHNRLCHHCSGVAAGFDPLMAG